MTHDLNNAAWSDSHGAAHEPRRDRNAMKRLEDACPAKEGRSPTSMEINADCIDTNFPGVSQYHGIGNDS